MATVMNCPNCGSQLAPGATSCARCGFKLNEPAPVDPAGPPAEAVTPTPALEHKASPGQAVTNFLDEMTTRWGVNRQSPVFIGAMGLAGGAFLVGTLALWVWLSAGSGEFEQQEDGRSLFFFALPAVIGAAALMVLLRLESGLPRGEAGMEDRRAFYAIVGLALAYMLVGAIKGFGKSLDAESAWFYYALVWSFFAMGLAVIARPVPAMIRGAPARTIGLAAIGLALVLGLLGVIQARSNSFSTYSMGVTLEDIAVILTALAFALFLGMRKLR